MAVARRTARDIRSDSRLDVLHAVLSAAEITRNELVQATGLSPATVATVVGELITAGILVETKMSVGLVGRPTATLGMNGAGGRVVGIDVAETYVRAVLFDTALNQLGFVEVERDEHFLTPELMVEAIGEALDMVLEQERVARDDVRGVGVSLPGLVHGSAGVSVLVPHWAWRTVDLDHLRERVALPLVIDNPLKAIATAELWLGRGRFCPNLVTVNLGTGVGAAIVLDGQIARGSTNSAGEWGHSLLALDGRECRCGRRGCVEAYVGAPGILRTLSEIAPDHPLVAMELQRDVIGAMARAIESPEPDDAVRETIARTAYYLGSALADLVAVVNPQAVTLTGWTAWALGAHMLPAVREHVAAQSPGQSADALELELSTVKGNSVATGVATIALERFLADAGLITTRIPIAL
ncbi:ROK family transcriptional regulator [Pseudactinotalea suaedae]|uniref:ROK family transcriptional regulator n=1 Tax=Pseudactinotalea suaedae TaxID=1524924 RepID=UPI0012E32A45|nr:ROK family transcriptional regulator [Pseudactinotalea suaedae]